MGTRRWQISPNTEILMMCCVGLGSTLMESSLSGMKENLVQVWDVKFQDFQFSPTNQQLIKSFISGIVLLRGFTVHLYLASYLLLLYPVIMERLRSMLLFWLLLSGFRSVLVNLAVALAGCALCSACADLRPHCFEFTAVKAFELGCSVYMWVNVNEFYQELKKDRRANSVAVGQVQVDTTITANATTKVDTSSTSTSSCSSIGEEDEWSLPQSFLDELDCSANAAGTEASEALASRSVDSILAQAMVDWFIKKVFKLKKKGEIVGKNSLPDPLGPGDVRNLQTRVRNSIADIEPGLSKGRQRKKYKWSDAVEELTTEGEESGGQEGGGGGGGGGTGAVTGGDKMKRLDRILMDTIYKDFDVYRSTGPLSDTNLASEGQGELEEEEEEEEDEASYSSDDENDFQETTDQPGNVSNNQQNQNNSGKDSDDRREEASPSGGNTSDKEDYTKPSLKSILKTPSKSNHQSHVPLAKGTISFKPDEELVQERVSLDDGCLATEGGGGKGKVIKMTEDRPRVEKENPLGCVLSRKEKEAIVKTLLESDQDVRHEGPIKYPDRDLPQVTGKSPEQQQQQHHCQSVEDEEEDNSEEVIVSRVSPYHHGEARLEWHPPSRKDEEEVSNSSSVYAGSSTSSEESSVSSASTTTSKSDKGEESVVKDAQVQTLPPSESLRRKLEKKEK